MSRTRLSFVAPLISKVVLGFGIFNIILGIGLFSLKARTLEFFIVTDLFSEQFWGALFFFAGLVILSAFTFNIWKLMRVGMLLGFSTKLFWLLALSIRQFEDLNTNIFLLIFFAMVAYLQLITYIHFPNSEKEKLWNRA